VIVDGITAARSAAPRSVEELETVLADEKGSIAPIGAGTQLEFGNPLKSADCAVSLAQLNRITTYNPDELTIHVEAGLPIGELHQALEANNQALPLDPWAGPTATIGGVAAVNAQGPLRATGTIRDWIIGMTVVHSDGRRSKTGGRVVKNVTGYDLAKLYTGSLGSLAVIAEISFKLRPRYEKTATAIAEFASTADASRALAAIRKSPVQPIACEWTGPNNALWLRFGEHPRAVDAQIAQLPKADWKVMESADESAAWERLRAAYAAMGPVVLRVIALPTEVAGIIDAHKPKSWMAHGANGIVLLGMNDAGAISAIRQNFPCILEKASREIRRTTGTFGVQGAAKRLMLEMKGAYDPERRLNPGRHIDGE